MKAIQRQVARGCVAAPLSSEEQAPSTCIFCFATWNECLLSLGLPHRPRELSELQASHSHSRQEGESGRDKRHAPARPSVERASYSPSSFCILSATTVCEGGWEIQFLPGHILPPSVREEEGRRGRTDSTRSVCHSHGSTNHRWESQVWGPHCVMWVFSQFLVS